MKSESRITEATPLKNEYSEKNNLEKFNESFHHLAISPRYLYIAYFINTSSLIGYVCVSITRSIYFTTELGFSDWQAGLLLALQNFISSLYSLTVGSIVDKYGIKFSIFISQLIALCGYVVMILPSNQLVKVVMLVGPIPLGFSLVVATIKLAIKRFTLPTALSIAFSILHMFVYLGDFISGIIVGVILSVNGINSTSFEIIFGIGAIFSLITIIFVFFIREIDLSRSGDEDILELENEVPRDISFRELLALKRYWRLVGRKGLLIIVRTIYSHI